MRWANFLHFYQPPTQKPFWVNKVSNEAYRPILKGLAKRPQNKVTLNVNGILLELLEKNGNSDIIDLLRQLLSAGQIELTGSAKYHPLLPFLPKEEIIRQVKLNEETLKKYFGNLWQPKGFFPPEMGFDKNVAQIVKDLGYKWIIVDELSCPKNQRPIDYSKLYKIDGLNDFLIYFRERRISWLILSGQIGTGNLMIKSLGDRLRKKEYLLTAMDGETFGHHRPGLENLLFEIYDSKKLQNVLISELPEYFKNIASVEPTPSTWALMEKDLEEKKPFSRWKDPDNTIQNIQWKLTDLAIEEMQKADKNAPGFDEARAALDRALHSDQYWWASARPWWSIEMIELGAKELADTVLKIPGVLEEKKNQARELYKSIIFTAFEWQRQGIVDQLSQAEDEDIRQRTDQGLPNLPKKEIEKMINQLRKEIKTVANKQEFERAAQLRDRVNELKRYASDQKLQLVDEGNQEFYLHK